jgi:hypothetical protein
VRGGDLAQGHQRRFGAEPVAKGVDARRRPQTQIREQAEHGNQGDAHQAQATAHPAQGRGQGDIVGA